jgi:hypothetical protein
MAEAAPQPRRGGWPLYGFGSALLATFVLIVGVALPWFERVAPPKYHYFSYTYSPAINAHPSNLPDLPDVKLQLLAMVYQGQWSMLFFLLTAAGALLALILAFRRPSSEGMGRAIAGNIILASASIVMTALMWYALGSDGTPGWHTEVRLGFLLAAPAQLLWLALAILQYRTYATAKRAGVLAPAPLPTA